LPNFRTSKSNNISNNSIMNCSEGVVSFRRISERQTRTPKLFLHFSRLIYDFFRVLLSKTYSKDCGGPWKCYGMKKWTEGSLKVRLPRLSKVRQSKVLRKCVSILLSSVLEFCFWEFSNFGVLQFDFIVTLTF
jgi:hypothetical protein